MKVLGQILTFVFLLLYSLVLIAFWLGCAGVGLWIMMWGMSQIRQDQDSTSWPTTIGRIQSATVQVTPGRYGSQNYWPDVIYEYRVDNGRYTNNTIIFGQSGPATQEYAESKVQQYAPGSTVTIYYNPQNPQQACLEPGRLIYQTYLALGLGTLFLIGGVWGFFQLFRTPKRRYSQPLRFKW